MCADKLVITYCCDRFCRNNHNNHDNNYDNNRWCFPVLMIFKIKTVMLWVEFLQWNNHILLTRLMTSNRLWLCFIQKSSGWVKRGQEQLRFSASNLLYVQNGVVSDQRCFWWLLQSCIYALNWYQNKWPWMTLNGRYTFCCIICILQSPLCNALQVRFRAWRALNSLLLTYYLLSKYLLTTVKRIYQ